MIRKLIVVGLLIGLLCSCASAREPTLGAIDKNAPAQFHGAEFFVKAIYFDKDQSRIRADAVPFLSEIAIDMGQYPGAKVEIAGARSVEEGAASLGMDRALAVRDYLVRLGVSYDRLTVTDTGTKSSKPCRYEKDICDKGNQRVIFRSPAK